MENTMSDGEKVILLSKENEEFRISRVAAELSVLIKNTTQDYPIDQPIPLYEIDSKCLKLIIEYLEHYNGNSPNEIEKPLPHCDFKEIVDEFQYFFMNKLTLEQLIDLTSAANFMEITSLLDLCCAKIASMSLDKTEDELYQTFGIQDTFTPEEREKLKEENQWMNLDSFNMMY